MTMMTTAEIQAKKQAIIDQYGPWQAHALHLQDDVWTMGGAPTAKGPFINLRRFCQVMADVTRQPLQELRILDLACLEGWFSIELALQGAEVVGVEGREENVAKARFVKEVYGLDNLTFHHDLVQNVSREKYGEFDIILCSGILYHLGAPDVFEVVEALGPMCRQALLVETHIWYNGKDPYEYKGQSYLGRFRPEYDPNYPPQFHGIDTDYAFCLTRPSLFNLLMHAGFTSVYECMGPVCPAYASVYRDRPLVVGIKGVRQTLKTAPPAWQDLPYDLWEERVNEIPTPLFLAGGDVVPNVYNPDVKMHC